MSLPAEVDWDFLYSLQRMGIKPGLENVTELCQRLGNPHHAVRFLHIAGTNGKGSVASTLFSILKESGYNAGLYTSPHLVDFRERIQSTAGLIPTADLARFLETLKPHIHAMRAEGYSVTFFEAVFALAMLWFKEVGADPIVLETGMGGRLDATNIVTPELSIITSIGLDHQQFLGDTVELIAGEKAGIIKHGIPVIVAQGETNHVMHSKAEQQQATLHIVPPARWLRFEEDFQVLHYADQEWLTPLLGRHQWSNIAVAIRSALHLQERGWHITPTTMQNGVRHTQWQGRFQRIRTQPPLILDGAHNLDGFTSAWQTWLDVYRIPPSRVIFTAMRNKPADFMSAIINSSEAEVWLVPLDSPHAWTPQELLQWFPHARLFDSIPSALEADADTPSPHGTFLLGSLYLVGSALAHLQNQTHHVKLNEAFSR